MILLKTTATIALLVACTWPAQADAVSDTRAAIQNAYDKQDASYLHEDVAGIAATLAPGYIWTNPRTCETHNEAEILDLGLTFGLFRSVETKTNILNITLNGSQAVVTSRSHTVLVPREADSNKIGPYTLPLVWEGLSTDTWVKRGSSWLEQRTETLSG